MKLSSKIVSGLLALIMVLSLGACGSTDLSTSSTPLPTSSSAVSVDEEESSSTEASSAPSASPTADPIPASFDLTSIPTYSGAPYVAVNNNVPYFSSSEMTTDEFERYSPLDSLGRCGVAYANICLSLMPTEDRESISEVKPTGWINNSYDCVDGGYLYNRCHLIGFQLAGENANEQNLITGTRSMNVDGMLPFENMVADYVKETGNHVLYRVSPIFEGSNLVASGVLMEAQSVEDNGDGIQFCVYCYNVQDGITIDYATGENYANGEQATETAKPVPQESNNTETVATQHYVLNTNTKKFHYPECRSVKQMSDKNRQDVEANREEIIAQGYDPCGNCNP